MPEQPPLLTAINLTLTTIDRRIRLYRVLVIFVIAVSLLAPLLSIYLKSWLVLLAMVSIIPAVVVYLYVDKRVVQKWARNVLILAREQKLDLLQFQQTIMLHRHLPTATIEGMLSYIIMEQVHGAITGASNEHKVPGAIS